MEVNGAPKQPGYKLSSKYLPLCSAEQRHSYRFGTTWEWVNDDRIFIFGWTIPLSIIFIRVMSTKLPMISFVEVALEYPIKKSMRPALQIVLPFCWKTSHLICYEHYWQNHQPIKFWRSMTARPLGLATCPVLPPVLDHPFSQGFPRNESETQWKENDGCSHRRLHQILLPIY